MFYVGLNDTWSALQNGAAGLPSNEEHRARELNLLERARRIVPEALRVAASRSALVRLAGLANPRPRALPGLPRPGLGAETLRALDANLRAADGLAASYGFRTSYFWEPCLFGKPRRTAYEERQATAIAYARDWLLGTAELARRDWAARSADELTYLGDVFAGTAAPRFIDSTHVGETGNREIAAAIARQLAGHGRLRASRGRSTAPSWETTRTWRTRYWQ